MKLSVWIRRSGYNNTQFAELIGVNRSQVSRIAHGLQLPSPTTAKRIIAVTKGQVSWRDLMGDA